MSNPAKVWACIFTGMLAQILVAAVFFGRPLDFANTWHLLYFAAAFIGACGCWSRVHQQSQSTGTTPRA